MQWALVKRDHDTAAELADKMASAGLNPSSLDDVITYSEGQPSKVSSIRLWRANNMYPSEPLFVRDPEGVTEDQGVLLSQVYDGNERYVAGIRV
jgi:hypothetical protein